MMTESRLGAVLAALLVAGLIAPAGAQNARRRQPGVLGGGDEGGTREIDECPPPSGDEQDRRARAEEHYDRGTTLFAQGDYENAVPEYVAGYCDAPHPRMLMAIGQAFERQVNFEKAVAYFERYILEAEEGDKDRERMALRVAVLRRQVARIRVATLPPGATVTVTGAAGVAAVGEANSDEPLKVLQGTYTLTVSLAGHEPISEEVTAEIGQPYSYFFRLEPQRGTLRVFASPGSARIFVDQRLAGIGNHVDQLPIGGHSITVEAEGREPVTRAVEIEAGRTADLRVQLPARPRSGRRELMVAATVGGGVIGGTLLASVFSDDATAAGLAALGGIGIGFGGAYFGIPEDIPVGTSSFVIGSTLIGGLEGALVTSLLSCDHTETTNAEGQLEIQEDCASDVISAVGLTAAVGGAAFAALTADRFDLDAGDAALLNSGALWGTTAGALFWTAFDTDPRVRSPLILVGLNLGLLAGGTLAARSQVSRGHVALIDLAGLGGGIVGVAIAGSVEESEDATERTSNFALAGIATGLIAGAYLTRNMDEPKSAPRLTPAVQNATDAAGRPVTLLGAALSL